MTNPEITSITADDIPAIATLQARADHYADYCLRYVERYKPSLTAQEKLGRISFWRTYYKDMAGHDDRLYSSYKWMVGGKLLGCIFTTAVKITDRVPTATTGRIEGLFVDPDNWGQKIGQRLMQSALDFLRQQGCNKSILWAEANNKISCGFYKHLGWTRRQSTLRPIKMNGRETGIVMYQRDLG